MKFPSFKRIFKTDYPQDQQSLVEKLSVTINNGFEVIYNAMANNVSLTDNIFCTVKTLTVTVDATGTPTSPLSYSISTTGVIQGISVLKAINQTKSTVYPTSSPFLSFTQNNNLITVTNIAGLPAGNSFQLVTVTWG